MKSIDPRPVLLLLAGLTLSGAALAEKPQEAAAANEDSTPLIDPAAMQALERMGAYLRGLQSFSVKAEDTLDEVLESGQKIQLTKTVEIQARRPDRLRADVETDRKARELYYDGRNFTLVAPESRYYTTIAAPATIRETLEYLQAKYDVEFPLADLFLWGESGDNSGAIQEAMRVGASRIAGQLADHYAFRQTDVDWQIWIAQGEAPLPLRYVITSKDVEGEPQFTANLSWDTAAKPDEAVFSFTPTKDDHPIAILATDDAPATP
ncbi:DUF2092 domain-containing protein [Allochromatium palmeri]|uniref:DUF2092 domain-containing protein n=1 Tax=Allochromatium palmeri TaxID=231048 RepID=A0A6N8E8X8_9GAMM|nr:DUF2092 domain-containing protein [Allochromatium palmeri]MTW20595.1 DUF2092 domain-containing protein [Allochromatium palmeri]